MAIRRLHRSKRERRRIPEESLQPCISLAVLVRRYERESGLSLAEAAFAKQSSITSTSIRLKPERIVEVPVRAAQSHIEE